MNLITRAWGDYNFRPAAVYPSAAVAAAADPRKQWDYVVVATKALPDRHDEAALVEPLVGPASALVLLQNGVGVEEPYRRRFPFAPIVSGIVFMSAEQVQLGTVRQNLGTRLVLGPYASAPAPAGDDHDDDDEAHDLLLAARGGAAAAQLASWFTGPGAVPGVEVLAAPGALQTARWRKLAINAAMNPSAVLCGGRGSGEMVADAELRAHLAGVMREIWDAVPQILGVAAAAAADDEKKKEDEEFEHAGAGGEVERAEPERPEAVLDLFARSSGASGARPSMLQDWEAGRPLELEVILGNPVRIARARGVELPRTQSLYALMRSAQALRNGRLRGGGRL